MPYSFQNILQKTNICSTNNYFRISCFKNFDDMSLRKVIIFISQIHLEKLKYCPFIKNEIAITLVR